MWAPGEEILKIHSDRKSWIYLVLKTELDPVSGMKMWKVILHSHDSYLKCLCPLLCSPHAPVLADHDTQPAALLSIIITDVCVIVCANNVLQTDRCVKHNANRYIYTHGNITVL